MNHQEILNNEYEKIFINHWSFLNNTYKSNIKKQYHRKKINNYENIQKVKEHVLKVLGCIPVFVFLTEICSNIKLPGPYYNIEKGILILEFLLNGYSISEMHIYDENDSFYKIYKTIFIDNESFLDEWIDKLMQNCFSNHITRLFYSSIHNPKNFEHCTLYLDGTHNKIIIEDIDLDKEDLYSYKLQCNGLNTQFVIDSAGFIVFISDSLPCKFNNDDNMFVNNVFLNKFLKLSDCLCFDGLYQNTINEVITKYNNVGLNINLNNFCFPIKKDTIDKNNSKNKKKVLTEDEEMFNKQLAAYRSEIETFFSKFSSTFRRFSSSSKARVTKEKTYNLQIKLCGILYNIKHFVELNKVEEKSYYKIWLDENFDFFNPNIGFDNFENSPKVNIKIENIKEMRIVQQDLMNNIASLTTLSLQNNKNKMQIDEININDTSDNNENVQNNKDYEIQYIIQHNKVINGYEYEVKWRNYSKKVNSWIHESQINSKEIIDKYWKSIE